MADQKPFLYISGQKFAKLRTKNLRLNLRWDCPSYKQLTNNNTITYEIMHPYSEMVVGSFVNVGPGKKTGKNPKTNGDHSNEMLVFHLTHFAMSTKQ